MRRRSRAAAAVAIALMPCACSDSSADQAGAPPPTAAACVAGEVALDDGRCLAAGSQPNGCKAGELGDDAGSCVPAGTQANGCAAGKVLRAGACAEPGVAPDACAAGFEPDGDHGCRPILPAGACPRGTFAVPGETACHSVADCATGTWGDIPVASDTQYVDASYGGADSDGSSSRPWTTIGDAIAAAAPGAIVAVAAGKYAEYVLIEDKPVKLWGKCPADVAVIGPATQYASILVWSGADGAEIHGLSASGPVAGIAVSGSTGIVVDRVWIEETGNVGFAATPDGGTTSVTLRSSLVESATTYGFYVGGGAEATLERSVVRDTRATSAGDGFGAIAIFDKAPAAATIKGSLLERNTSLGVMVEASSATIDASVIRGTLEDPEHASYGGMGIHAHHFAADRASLTMTGSSVEGNRVVGIALVGADATIDDSVVKGTVATTPDDGMGIEADDEAEQRSSLTLRTSAVEDNGAIAVAAIGSDATIDAAFVAGGTIGPGGSASVGIFAGYDVQRAQPASLTLRSSVVHKATALGVAVYGSPATIEGTLIEDTQTGPDPRGGSGFQARALPVRAEVDVRACVLDKNSFQSIGVFGSDVTIEGTLVRDTRVGGTPPNGRSIEIEDEPEVHQRANVTLRGCVLEHALDAGVVAFGADLLVEGAILRDTDGLVDGEFGRAIHLEDDPITADPSSGIFRYCLIDDVREMGIVAIGSKAVLQGVAVTSVAARASDAAFGDGVVALSDPMTMVASEVEVTGCRIEKAARAAVSNFAASASIGSTLMSCNAIDLDGEYFEFSPTTFHDDGGNACSCNGAAIACQVLSQSLAPPEAISR